ncbi:MAG: hypothetical protein ACRDVG_03255 [Jatrophihabitantaceae bacterium]
MSAFRAVLVALSATVLTAACAAGQQAQTADEITTVDGTQGSVGNIQLESVALQAPSGPSYADGASVPLTAYIVNNGQSADSLVRVSSSAFTGGWDVVSTPALLPGPSGAAGAASSAAPSSGRAQKIGAGAAVGFGLTDLSPSGAGSPETLVLRGLTNGPLFPGTAVKITFTFADAGQTTLTVPVQVSAKPNNATLPPATGSVAG